MCVCVCVRVCAYNHLLSPHHCNLYHHPGARLVCALRIIQTCNPASSAVVLFVLLQCCCIE